MLVGKQPAPTFDVSIGFGCRSCSNSVPGADKRNGLIQHHGFNFHKFNHPVESLHRRSKRQFRRERDSTMNDLRSPALHPAGA